MLSGFPEVAPLPPFSSSTYILRRKEGLFFLILPMSEQVPKGDEPGENGPRFPRQSSR